MRIVLGVLAPTGGTVLRAPSLRMGYVPQKIHFDRSFPLSVKRFLTLKQSVSLQNVENVLEKTGALHLIQYPLQEVSGGELQRILLARALLNDPDLLLLDEPAQGVDVVGQAGLYQLIQDIQRERCCTVLIVSHDLHFVMANTNEVICLNKTIGCSGTPEKVSTHPAFLEFAGPSVQAQFAWYHHSHQGNQSDQKGNGC